MNAQPLSKEAAQLHAPNGADLITDTAPHEGDWFAIHFVEDTDFAILRGEGLTGDFTAPTFLAGTTIYNARGFKKIDLSGGAVLAYRQ